MLIRDTTEPCIADTAEIVVTADTADTALKADTADTVEAILQQSTPEPPSWYRFLITQLPS